MVVAGGLLMGAAPAHEELPVPPIPPTEHPAYNSAPIPNDNIRGPTEAEASSVRLAPSLFRREKDFTPGLGYTPGSAFKETEKERSIKPSPGLDVRVRLP